MNSRKLQLVLLTFGVMIFTACKKQDSLGYNPEMKKESSVKTKQTALLNYTLSNWMSFIPDTTSIAQISIPGTHDSGARFEPVSGTAKCQNLTIADQLTAGVRFLDVRCRHFNNSFTIHHDLVYQNLNFSDVLKACIDFLDANPSETVIMSVKEEYTPSGNTRSFEETFDAYVKENASKWDLGTDISRLSSIRGKIKLLRRFSTANAKGIDATAWKDNATFEINNKAANLKIQDEYKVSKVEAKWASVNSLLNAAHDDTSNRLYINFGSGFKSLIFGIPDIIAVNNYINPKITTFFSGNTNGKYGVIPLNFITADLSRGIVKSNFNQAL